MPACPYCSASLTVTAKAAPRPILVACGDCKNPVVMTSTGAAWSAAPTPNTGDIRETAPPGSIGAALLNALPAGIERLPILPEISQRILTMMRDPEVSMRNLADLIRQDSVIAIKILKLANSALYGGLSEIKDLDAACARLGLQHIGNAVQAIANGAVYVAQDPELKSMMQRLWQHAVASAHAAYCIAQMLAEPRADTLFVAGLTHDIGAVLMIDIIGDHEKAGNASDVLATLRANPALFREALENFQTLCSLHVLQAWGLPPEFGIMAYCHKHINRSPDEHWNVMAHIIALASAIADLSGLGLFPEEDIALLGHPSVKYLGLSDMKLAVLRVDLEDKIAPLLEISGA